MISTHMGYGFVFAYFLTLLFEKVVFSANSVEIVGLSVAFVMCGFIGGLFPDFDRMEQLGFSHRKTLHYPIGYGLLALLVIAIGYFTSFTIWIIGLFCFFSSAWLHSAMDILDGFYLVADHGVFEHITRKWIKPLNWIPYASKQEWSAQALSTVAVIAISPFLPKLYLLSGWVIATLIYLVLWGVSTFYEFRITVPKRLEMEKRVLGTLDRD